MASSRIEPATFRLLAQFLNQIRYRVPFACYVPPANNVPLSTQTVLQTQGFGLTAVMAQCLLNGHGRRTRSVALHAVKGAGASSNVTCTPVRPRVFQYTYVTADIGTINRAGTARRIKYSPRQLAHHQTCATD
jgi:hypothetical protein